MSRKEWVRQKNLPDFDHSIQPKKVPDWCGQSGEEADWKRNRGKGLDWVNRHPLLTERGILKTIRQSREFGMEMTRQPTEERIISRGGGGISKTVEEALESTMKERDRVGGGGETMIPNGG